MAAPDPLERVAALAGAGASVVLTALVWRAVSGQQPTWPFPALYFVELMAVGVLVAATYISGRSFRAAIAWAAAAAGTSLFCRRGTRMGAGLGVALGGAVVLGGYALWSLTGPRLVWPSTTVLQQLAASLILMAAVLALGPPVRGHGQARSGARRARSGL